MICNLNTPSSSPRGLKSPYVRTTACWGPEVCYSTNIMGIYGSLCHLESISHPACHPGWKRKVTLGMVMGGMCCQCLAPSGDPIGFEPCLWGKIPIPACVEAGGEHIAHHCPSYLGWCPPFPEMSTETVQRADREKQAEAIWREPCHRLSGCPSQCSADLLPREESRAHQEPAASPTAVWAAAQWCWKGGSGLWGASPALQSSALSTAALTESKALEDGHCSESCWCRTKWARDCCLWQSLAVIPVSWVILQRIRKQGQPVLCAAVKWHRAMCSLSSPCRYMSTLCTTALNRGNLLGCIDLTQPCMMWHYKNTTV